MDMLLVLYEIFRNFIKAITRRDYRDYIDQI